MEVKLPRYRYLMPAVLFEAVLLFSLAGAFMYGEYIWLRLAPTDWAFVLSLVSAGSLASYRAATGGDHG